MWSSWKEEDRSSEIPFVPFMSSLLMVMTTLVTTPTVKLHPNSPRNPILTLRLACTISRTTKLFQWNPISRNCENFLHSMSIRRQNVFVFTPARMVFGGEKFNFLYFLDDGKKLGWISTPGKGDVSFLIMDQFSFPFFRFPAGKNPLVIIVSWCLAKMCRKGVVRCLIPLFHKARVLGNYFHSSGWVKQDGF